MQYSSCPEKNGKKLEKKSFGPLCMWTDVRLRTPGRKNRVAKCTLGQM